MSLTKTPDIGINRTDLDWKFEPTTEQQERKSFSADTVINAYLQGRRDQSIERENVLTEKFNENLDKAKKISSKFYGILKDKGITCKHILLRPNKITEFESIFVVDKNDYVSPQFEDIYKLAILEKTQENSDTFHFTFIFIPYSENLNRDKLSTDGYILEYVKK